MKRLIMVLLLAVVGNALALEKYIELRYDFAGAPAGDVPAIKARLYTALQIKGRTHDGSEIDFSSLPNVFENYDPSTLYRRLLIERTHSGITWTVAQMNSWGAANLTEPARLKCAEGASSRALLGPGDYFQTSEWFDTNLPEMVCQFYGNQNNSVDATASTFTGTYSPVQLDVNEFSRMQYAAALDGTQRVENTVNDLCDWTAGFTVLGWFQIAEDSQMMLMAQGDQEEEQDGFQIAYAPTGKLIVRLFDGANYLQAAASGLTVDLDTWYSFGVTWDGTDENGITIMFEDGVASSNKSESGTFTSGTYNGSTFINYLGNSRGNDSGLNGKLHQMNFYDGVLPGAQLTTWNGESDPSDCVVRRFNR